MNEDKKFALQMACLVAVLSIGAVVFFLGIGWISAIVEVSWSHADHWAAVHSVKR